MNSALYQIGIVCLCYFVYCIVHAIYSTIRFNRFARSHDCQPPFDRSRRFAPFRFVHGLTETPEVLSLRSLGKDIIDDFLVRNFEPADTVSTTTIGGTIIWTMEPTNVQAMLASQFKEYVVGQLRVSQFFPLLGRSIFSSDGSFWEHSRALFRPQFNRENINDLASTDRAVQELIEAVGAEDENGWTSSIELLPLLYHFTLDTATEFLFGESVQSQRNAMLSRSSGSADSEIADSGYAISQQFAHDLNIANQYTMDRVRYGPFYWIADGIKFRRATHRVKQFTERFVRKAIEQVSSGAGKNEEGKKYNLLSALATETQDRTELRNQTLALLVAGRDSTAALLGWCFVRLALHPDIHSSLRAAIVRDFTPQEPITFAKLKGCRALQHFLNEVLRLHPTVPLNVRFATQDTTLPVGGGPDQRSPVAVHKGQMVGYSVYFMHRRKDLWGEDALEFKPERWERKIPAWQFLPFNGGPRICLGQQFALTEASYVLLRVIQRFDRIEPVDEAEMRRMKKGLGLTLWPEDQVRVRFHRDS